MDKSRRRFLIQLLAASGVAATGRLFWVKNSEWIPEELTKDEDWEFLNPEHRLVLSVLTPVILLGVTKDKLSGEELVIYLKRFDKSITYLNKTQQLELVELFDLLSSLLGRVVLAGVWSSWNQLPDEDIHELLSDWRFSFLDLIKTAYIGLKQLSYAAWYGQESSWADIGYPGPPVFHHE